jgi:thiol-disulfide isomerase/thioredoxin
MSACVAYGKHDESRTKRMHQTGRLRFCSMLDAFTAPCLSAIVRPQLRATHGVQHRTMKQVIALLIAMGHRRSFLFLSLLLVPSLTTMAAAQTNDVNTQLKNVVDKIRAKTVAWKMPEAELTPELEELDAIYLQHKGENPEDLANVLRLKATVYWSIVDNSEKGIAVIRQLKKDYPNTTVGRDADGIISSIQQHEEIRKNRRTLTNGAKFPDFCEKDLLGNPLSVSHYEDKVVLVEFWATWCGPCVAELPNIIKAYKKHHADGFEVIGISLDQDEQKLKSFLKTKDIPWPQYFDGKDWQNKLVAKYGIDSVPATFLLDRQGKIIAQDLRGEALEEALTKALTNVR